MPEEPPPARSRHGRLGPSGQRVARGQVHGVFSFQSLPAHKISLAFIPFFKKNYYFLKTVLVNVSTHLGADSDNLGKLSYLFLLSLLSLSRHEPSF